MHHILRREFIVGAQDERPVQIVLTRQELRGQAQIVSQLFDHAGCKTPVVVSKADGPAIVLADMESYWSGLRAMDRLSDAVLMVRGARWTWAPHALKGVFATERDQVFRSLVNAADLRGNSLSALTAREGKTFGLEIFLLGIDLETVVTQSLRRVAVTRRRPVVA